MLIRKVLSGGQTGVDRAALDWAICKGVEHGGWCPKGRLAEDGPIHMRYHLTETPTLDHCERTEWNVRDSDGTVIFSGTEPLAGGSLLTLEMAIKHRKPYLHLQSTRDENPGETLRQWIQQHRIQILNVAGPRASEEPEISKFVTHILNEALPSRAPRT